MILKLGTLIYFTASSNLVKLPIVLIPQMSRERLLVLWFLLFFIVPFSYMKEELYAHT